MLSSRKNLRDSVEIVALSAIKRWWRWYVQVVWHMSSSRLWHAVVVGGRNALAGSPLSWGRWLTLSGFRLSLEALEPQFIQNFRVLGCQDPWKNEYWDPCLLSDVTHFEENYWTVQTWTENASLIITDEDKTMNHISGTICVCLLRRSAWFHLKGESRRSSGIDQPAHRHECSWTN